MLTISTLATDNHGLMIIFTDLDGTLLDHKTYRFDAAIPALSVIKEEDIPLILASSKTAAEIAPIQQAIGIKFPAIVENGAGVYWPGDSQANNSDYLNIRESLDALPSILRDKFVGFGDMGVEGIQKSTGLDQEAAKLAATRCHSEPGLFSGDQKEKADFLQALDQMGIKATQGGRFLTLSLGATKADQMAAIGAHFLAQGIKTSPSLALGDAPNDIAMLEAADFGIIIPNEAHGALPVLKGEASGRIKRAESDGPIGWNHAVLSFIEATKHTSPMQG